MANILKSQEYVARLPRYGHDLSRRLCFTSSVGQLLPVMTDFLSPGDSVKLNASLFTRTQPLKTAAFARVTERLYYFFVPMCHVDPYFDNAFFGISDFNNTNDLSNPSVNAAASRSSANTPATSVPNVNYGQLRNIFKGLKFSTADNAWYVDDTSTNYDEYGIPRVFNYFRLLSLLRYGDDVLGEPLDNSIGRTVVNLYKLFAYQKIYFDFFRQSKFENNIPAAYNCGYLAKEGASFYSKDLVNLGLLSYSGALKLRYHPMKKDFFTNVEPTPLYDPSSSLSGYGLSAPSSSDANLNISYVLSQYGILTQDPSNGIGILSDGSVQQDSSHVQTQVNAIKRADSSYYTSVQYMRFAYAFDKLMQITQRAGKHVDDQTLAHFGVRPPKGISNEVYFLGSHSQRLQIGEVVATATSSASDETSVLGQIAGRGLSVSKNQKDISFKAPCHGILMCIYSAIPEIDYRSQGVERFNLTLAVNQFPRPEMDKLGMQPLFALQAYTPVALQTVLGWQYRYSEYKLSYDMVNGAFQYTLSDWVPSVVFGFQLQTTQYNDMRYAFYIPPTYLDNQFALSFVPPKDTSGHTIVAKVYGSETPVDAAEFASSNGFDPSICYERDPLLHSVDFKYYKTSFMSTYGMPNI